jgi:hypothetical protein
MIIGLCGYKGSGKSTVADYLRNTHGFSKINFKDALVSKMKALLPKTLNELAQLYNCSVDELFVTKPPAHRALMQEFGTDIFRGEMGDDYWVNEWRKSVDNPLSRIVTDDVRFTNEANAIKMKGGIIIRVIMQGLEQNDLHVSETEHLKIKEDFVIIATRGDHAGVYAKVEEILETIKNNNEKNKAQKKIKVRTYQSQR